MNFFKRIFQKGSSSAKSITTEAISSNINFADFTANDEDAKILPVLKNRLELDLQKKRGMFVDELFPSSNENSPLVMYGKDRGICIEYSPSKSSESDLTTKEEAINNLKNIEIPFEINNESELCFSIIQHEYAAEKILDKNFMKVLANELSADELTVGIPMKGVMVAAPKEAAQALVKMTESIYDSGENDPISKSLFLVSSGEIIAMTA